MSIDPVPWLVWGGAPCQRYNSAYRALSAANGSISPEEAIWSAVYDMSTGEIQVVMDKECDQIHAFQLEMKDATVSRAGAFGEEPGAS